MCFPPPSAGETKLTEYSCWSEERDAKLMAGKFDRQMRAELVDGILAALQGQVKRIILYGSVARGTETAESDVDIAVFVMGRLNEMAEDRLSDVVVDMNLKYDRVFSVIDIDDTLYQKWREVTPFYQNIDEDGIVLWTAA